MMLIIFLITMPFLMPLYLKIVGYAFGLILGTIIGICSILK